MSVGLSDAIGAASRGMELAMRRADAAAEDVAGGSFAAVLGATDDRAILHGLLELPQARTQLFASAATLRAADEMLTDVVSREA